MKNQIKNVEETMKGQIFIGVLPVTPYCLKCKCIKECYPDGLPCKLYEDPIDYLEDYNEAEIMGFTCDLSEEGTTSTLSDTVMQHIQNIVDQSMDDDLLDEVFK